jgi:hypothetical protein
VASAVISRAFVKPTFAEARVYADGQHVLVADVGEIRYIKTERRIAAEVLTQVMAIRLIA